MWIILAFVAFLLLLWWGVGRSPQIARVGGPWEDQLRCRIPTWTGYDDHLIEFRRGAYHAPDIASDNVEGWWYIQAPKGESGEKVWTPMRGLCGWRDCARAAERFREVCERSSR